MNVKKNSHLKSIYAEIIRGASPTRIGPNFLYIRHPSTVESAELEYKYEEFLKEAINSGIETSEEKEKYLISVGLWSNEKNLEILKWKEFLKSMAITKSKLLLKADIDGLNTQIQEGELQLLGLEMEKREILGLTAENYASQKFNDVTVLNSFFIDSGLKTLFFQKHEEIDSSEINLYLENYSEVIHKFREENIKRLAIQPFFQNTYYLSENDIYKYYGKPIIDLTIYQISLFNLAGYYKEALKAHGGEITDEILDNPDSFVEKVVQKKNIDQVLENAKDGSASSIVGMTAEDRKRAGITKGETIGLSKFVGKTFEQIAAESK